MKISAKTRAAAIHCLEQCASDRIGKAHRVHRETCTFDVENGDAEYLACEAWIAVDKIRAASSITVYLEAAALLRGDELRKPWSPGEPVVILATGRKVRT